MDHERERNASSYSPELRRRADNLVELAGTIERALVLTLPDVAARVAWSTRRARLCEQMLECNLHQLHRSADELRQTAMRFRNRADELDAALRRAA